MVTASGCNVSAECAECPRPNAGENVLIKVPQKFTLYSVTKHEPVSLSEISVQCGENGWNCIKLLYFQKLKHP